MEISVPGVRWMNVVRMLANVTGGCVYITLCTRVGTIGTSFSIVVVQVFSMWTLLAFRLAICVGGGGVSQHADFVNLRASSLCVGGGGVSQHADFVSLRAGSLCVGGGGVSQHADFVSLWAGSLCVGGGV